MRYLIYLLLGLGSAAQGAAETVDRERLERAEDLSESLANQLHDFSLALRDGNWQELAAHFAPQIEVRDWPQPTGAPEPVSRWVLQQAHQLDREITGAVPFAAAWRGFLQPFAVVEDVRFKVKQAHFEEGAGHASIYFFLVGRDAQKRRAWVEAKGEIDVVRQGEGGWLVERFGLKELHSRRAASELFSEVALAAGVHRVLPPFGQPGNQSFGAPGVAVADVDGNGLMDVCVTGPGGNVLYLNQGDGTFVDVAATVGVQTTPPATAPLFVDFDGDNDVDLFLASTGFQMLFENRLVPEGQLNFIDISQQAGVAYPAQGYSAASADVDGDGRPDIYVASYNRYGTIMPDSWSRATNGTPNLLFINQGDGTFVETATAWGVADRRWSYAAHFGDIDEDGRQDLYVANDFGENGLYLNQGGRFREAARESGALDPGNGMGVSLGDFDNDGRLDLHVTNMSSTAGMRILHRLFPDDAAHLSSTRVLEKLASGNSLLRNEGGGRFQDVSASLGPLGAGWAFGGGFVDFDNDGWMDIHAPNGFVSGKSLKDT
ncbi:MAG: hypothetical protein GKR89_10815 [Candidatus Latescibacteria bacterium]|nr:hypothetical protein [Candidatus Latescibacterota bacterium]